MAPHAFRVGDWTVQSDLDRLERDGRVIHLRPKTMLVLVELAGRPGEVVTREDLQRRVWADVHVSEENLSHCIAEIRSALGDDPKTPAYIETVAKHGYRLIAPVGPVPSPAPLPVVLTAGPFRDLPARRIRIAALLIGVAAVVAVSGALILRRPAAPTGGGTHEVVLADWGNRTGDPVFDETLRQALAVVLSDAPYIRVVSRERTALALRLLRRAPGDRLDADLARQVCRRIGADLVAAGDVASMGGEFVVHLEVTPCSSMTPLMRAQATARGKNQVLDAVGQVAGQLRRHLAGTPADDRAAGRSVEDVTTSNLDALRAFSLANDALAERKIAEALGLFTHAIELDPEFALAHSRLGSALAALREWTRANQHRKRAMDLSASLTERECLYVQAAYKLGIGRATEAEDRLKTWVKLYPGDRVPLTWLAVAHVNRGEVAEALSWGEAAVKVDASPESLLNLAAVHLSAGRVADARAITEGLNEPGIRYLLAVLERDEPEMTRQCALVASGSVEELDMCARQAQAAMAVGHCSAARALTGRAESIGLQLGLFELTSQVLATQALWEAEAGDPRLGVDMARAALSMHDNPSTRALAVLAFTRAGALDRARARLRGIEQATAALDPIIAAGCQRKLAAALALAAGRPAEALEQLKDLTPYENGGVVNHVALRGDLAELGVFHLRGLAHLALGHGAEAAAEFRRIIARRGASPLSPYVAMAPLNLGRACALSGDARAARAAYDVFLKQWASADRDARLVAEARLEYAGIAGAAAGNR